VPVKRRRALLASIPLRNSRPELIATMGRAQNFPVRSDSLGRTSPESGKCRPRLKKGKHIGAIGEILARMFPAGSIARCATPARSKRPLGSRFVASQNPWPS
jgi:hypothetical protein